jgi:GTP-binding protein LepA
VDASQGVEAQTVANVYLALENDLELIPVINKCDLPQADPEGVAREVEEVIGLDCSNAIFASAKSGEGLQETLNAIVEQIPPPKAAPADPLRALIFDSYYDPYKGVVVFFRIHEGTLRKGESIRFFGSGKEYTVDDLGVMAPNKINVDVLGSGEVGFLSAHIKQVSDARVGDTITSVKQPAEKQLEGYQEARPMVFCGLFTTDKDDYEDLRDALEKLQLNDSALTFEPEISTALGFGFRVGFLGLLHLEIVQERLEREYSLDLVTTAPTVRYRVVDHNNERHEVESPSSMPPPEKRAAIEEPFARMDILTPSDYVGKIMELCHERRGEFKNMSYINPTRASLSYDMPLAEVVTDFFDQVKSRSKGYASMEYTYLGYRTSELVRLDMKVNGEMMEPLSCIVHREKAHSIGRQLCKKLAKRIERHNFKIPIQAAIGGTIVASEHIAALRKDVLAKCYGGDVSRKVLQLSMYFMRTFPLKVRPLNHCF